MALCAGYVFVYIPKTLYVWVSVSIFVFALAPSGVC